MNRARQLDGRRILVTGAASGMGYAIAELFAAQGARLGLIDRDKAGLEKIVAATKQLALPCDLTSEPSIAEAVSSAVRGLGGIDGIINAAGIYRELPLEETSTAIFDDVIAINLRGPFLLTRHALAELRKAPVATIVNIASNAAVAPHAHSTAYSASKAGLVGLTRVWAKELGPTIRASAICPGMIKTGMTRELFAEGGVGDAAVQSRTALKRAGQPNEIAECALYLTAETSSYVSGAVLEINGGMLP